MLSPRLVDEELRRFVLACIPSVSYLEALLLFRRRAGRCSIDEAAEALYLARQTASDLLLSLVHAGVLARREDDFEYAPDPSLDTMLERLAQAYAEDLVGITALIHEKEAAPRHRLTARRRATKD